MSANQFCQSRSYHELSVRASILMPKNQMRQRASVDNKRLNLSWRWAMRWDHHYWAESCLQFVKNMVITIENENKKYLLKTFKNETSTMKKTYSWDIHEFKNLHEFVWVAIYELLYHEPHEPLAVRWKDEALAGGTWVRLLHRKSLIVPPKKQQYKPHLAKSPNSVSVMRLVWSNLNEQIAT